MGCYIWYSEKGPGPHFVPLLSLSDGPLLVELLHQLLFVYQYVILGQSFALYLLWFWMVEVVIDTAHFVCGAGLLKWLSLRPSVCLSHWSTAAEVCGGFAAEEIVIDSRWLCWVANAAVSGTRLNTGFVVENVFADLFLQCLQLLLAFVGLLLWIFCTFSRELLQNDVDEFVTEKMTETSYGKWSTVYRDFSIEIKLVKVKTK